MTLRYTFALFAISLFIQGCSRELPNNYFFDNLCHPAIPHTVSSDTSILLVRDYFPLIGDITNVSSKDYEVIPISKGLDTVMLVVTPNTTNLSTLDVLSKKEKGSIIIKRGISSAGSPPSITTTNCDKGHNNFTVRVINTPAKYIVMWQNTTLGTNFITYKNEGEFIVTIPTNSCSMKRSFIRIFAANNDGVGNDILVPLENGKVITTPSLLDRSDWQKQIMYSILIDRFYNGNEENDWKINSKEVLPKVDYFGGDIAGITKKLRAGYFDTLGVNTLWISPISQNPTTAWGQNIDPKTKFSGYHGYWPIYITKLDNRFATPQELEEMIDEAHSRGDNVVLDYVAHHMHIDSPTLNAHPDWTTPSKTPDGRENLELWDEFRLTTWFDYHIPSLDLEREEVNEPLTDSALFWMKNYNFDGFRHDATKHVPEVFWRKLTKKINSNIVDRPLYQIGETYGSSDLISSYVKSGMMDGQFDFNIYDNFINATTDKENGSFVNLAQTIDNSLKTYGYHNLMGYITGNHDRPRYISLAGGDVLSGEDTKAAGWKRKIGVTDTLAYRKLSLLHSLIFTLPGVPCVYYGDEYGQPGANDPDNRRWGQFSPQNRFESEVFDNFKKLSKLRNSNIALLYGDYYPLVCEKEIFSYIRTYMGQYVLIAMNKSGEKINKTIILPFDLKLNGEKSISMVLEPYSYKILTNY